MSVHVCMYHLVFFMLIWWRMSALTRGVAVAVRAITGTCIYSVHVSESVCVCVLLKQTLG